MQPQLTAVSNGTATPGSAAVGPFEGPLTLLEPNLPSITLTRAVTLQDAIAQLETGAAPAQGHAYLLCVGDLASVKATLYSGQLSPGSAQRSVPKLTFPAGTTLLVKAVQLSGSAAEITNLVLRWA
jgi:hypothetical protein